ncbi:MAG TPA: hypothetical protein VMF66_15905 [Candidatus Acidoferrum sp.]|nr:hypothetical protein [Candidatus Acidoferrum sp.]
MVAAVSGPASTVYSIAGAAPSLVAIAHSIHVTITIAHFAFAPGERRVLAAGSRPHSVVTLSTGQPVIYYWNLVMAGDGGCRAKLVGSISFGPALSSGVASPGGDGFFEEMSA